MEQQEPLSDDEFQLLTCTSDRLIYKTIDPILLKGICPLHDIQGTRIGTSPLETLPLELVHLILELLDIQGLTNLRTCSPNIQSSVDSFPPYHTTFTHCRSAIRALLVTNMACHFTATDLCLALYEYACQHCGRYGAFLDLFTCKRYCHCCILDYDFLLPTVTITFAKKHGFYHAGMPILSSTPGDYGHVSDVRYHTRKYKLLRLPLSCSSNGHFPRMNRRLLDLQQQNYMRKSQFRYMSLIRIPFLDRNSGKHDWGVSCSACDIYREHDDDYFGQNPLCLSSQYHEHFEMCVLSQVWREQLRDDNARMPGDTYYNFQHFRRSVDPVLLHQHLHNLGFRISR